MTRKNDSKSDLVAVSSSPVTVAPFEPVTASNAKTLIIAANLLNQLINFIEGPAGQAILNYLRETKSQSFRNRMRVLGQRLIEAGGGKHVN